MATYIRSDGWVKTAQGPAVPGAEIFICNQPANIVSLPPSPLATIYADPLGAIPITQPILTDGFGHYDFYTLPGTYTLVVGLGGVVQQVYVDQNVGGTANSTLLQTNNVNNPLQSVLNLIAGSGVVLTPDGAGGVTINAVVNTTTFINSPSWWMSGDGSNYPFSVSNGTFSATGIANQVRFWMVRIPYTIVIKNFSLWMSSTQAGSVSGFAVYNAAGTVKYTSWDNINTATGSAHSLALVSAVTLQPGLYLFACATSVATVVSTQGGYQTDATSEATQPWNSVTPRSGVANNPMVTGVMPATLGTLTATNSSTAVNGVIPCICMEP